MNFRCPNPTCDSEVRLGDSACAKCGQSLGFFSVLTLTFKGWWRWLKGVTHTRCPECKAVIPFREALCPSCGKPVTFMGAVDATVTPTRNAVGKFLRSLSPEAKTGVRWSYVIVSALLFWILLSRVERAWTRAWDVYAMMAVVYLAFLYLFFLWIVPRTLRAKVARRIRMATKIAVIFNFFSFLLLLLLFIAHNTGKASKIAILFLITFGGFWLFCTFMRNLWVDLATDWTDAPPTFNHLGNQGRTAYRD